jgi:hypothetical protein
MEIIIDVDKVLEEAGFDLVRLPGRAFHATLGRDQGDHHKSISTLATSSIPLPGSRTLASHHTLVTTTALSVTESVKIVQFCYPCNLAR